MPMQPFEGPIPGENFTSDTRNYAWHRPPDFTDIDPAIEWSVTKLTRKDALNGFLTMVENGMTIAHAATVFCMSGVGNGKWTPDFAILLAGPIARVMEILTEVYGIEADLGIEDNIAIPTKAYFSAIREAADSDVEEVGNEVAEAFTEASDEQPRGFMSASDAGGMI